MNKFKIGDRVATYDAERIRTRHVGTIKDIMNNNEILLIDIGNQSLDEFHYKQCRKIKSKKTNRDLFIEHMNFILNYLITNANDHGVYFSKDIHENVLNFYDQENNN